jgi:5-oxopent-3-ene-1,2,5-tricarboxylate decarboxylase / 2-hydroxyhepta-2,4-diene-1,7-dioate isomerase
MTFLHGWLNFDGAPHRLSGVVYGTLLNHRPTWEALGDQMHQAPYKAAPQAPVLYLKPRNTLARHDDEVTVPADAPELQVGATLGIVIGRTACRLTSDNALDHVAGYTVVNDVSVPHDSFYRPSVRFKARDGFCPIGPTVVPRDAIANPDALNVKVWVDGVLQQASTTGDRVRHVARLLADVTDFMTLQPGDVLLLGVSAGAQRVQAGQEVAIEIEGVGRLVNHFKADTLASGARA